MHLIKLDRRWWPIATVVALISVSGLTAAGAAFVSGDASPTEPAVTTTSDPSTSGAASGGGGSVNNEVIVFNITDGRHAHRARSGIARVTGGDVTNTNSAAATSACTDCRTVAVAVQAVLVMGDSDHIAPRNQAVAINNNCVRCDTYALAYQYVVSTNGVVRFTAEGHQRIAELEAQIADLTASELPFLELEAQIDAVVERIWAVVDEEAVAVGGRPEGSPTKARDLAEDGATTSPSPTDSPETTSTAPNTEDETTEPDASPTSEPEPTPTESNSPSP